MYTIVSGTYDVHKYGTFYPVIFDAVNIPCEIPTTVSTAVRVAHRAVRIAEYCSPNPSPDHEFLRNVSSNVHGVVDFMTTRIDHASTILGRLDTYHVSNRDVCLINACIPDIVHDDLDGLGEWANVNQNNHDFDQKHSFQPGTAAHFCLHTSAREHFETNAYSDDPFDFTPPSGDVPLRLMRCVKAEGHMIVAEFVVRDWVPGVDPVVARVTLVLQPRGWARVRHVLRVRSIVVYWLGLTETLMAPGGSARKRDRDAYEAEEYAYDVRTTLPYAI